MKKKITDTDRLDWLLETDAIIVQGDDVDGDKRYRALQPPLTYLTREWYSSPREAIDGAITNPKKR